ncbi:MAG TPA: phosphatase RsbU N-terminal domain-containing protein [Propionibacteriaceae bacterium]|nr:phosphatase RsbU N-terminal domain-containing protein [Propionibacteriaceae bacterium]
MTSLIDLERNYRAAFFRFLPSREEAALRTGYEIGRSAVADGLSILDLAQVHHQVFLEVLQSTAADELNSVATAASEFFLEVLATYDMAARGKP